MMVYAGGGVFWPCRWCSTFPTLRTPFCLKTHCARAMAKSWLPDFSYLQCRGPRSITHPWQQLTLELELSSFSVSPRSCILQTPRSCQTSIFKLGKLSAIFKHINKLNSQLPNQPGPCVQNVTILGVIISWNSPHYLWPPMAFCTDDVKNSSLKKSRDPRNMTRALLRACRAAISRVFLPTACGNCKQTKQYLSGCFTYSNLAKGNRMTKSCKHFFLVVLALDDFTYLLPFSF